MAADVNDKHRTETTKRGDHPAGVQSSWPGSDEWVRQEKLFDLVAICEACHDDVHAAKRTRKAAA